MGEVAMNPGMVGIHSESFLETGNGRIGISESMISEPDPPMCIGEPGLAPPQRFLKIKQCFCRTAQCQPGMSQGKIGIGKHWLELSSDMKVSQRLFKFLFLEQDFPNHLVSH